MELKDISNIPYFAYAPGVYAWGGLILTIIICLTLFKYLSGRKKSSNFKALDKSLAELRKLEQSLAGREDFRDITFAASMIVRRAVSHVEGDDISPLSENELKAKQNAAPAGLKTVLAVIIETEKQKYSPELSTDNTRAILKNLTSALSDYKIRQEMEFNNK